MLKDKKKRMTILLIILVVLSPFFLTLPIVVYEQTLPVGGGGRGDLQHASFKCNGGSFLNHYVEQCYFSELIENWVKRKIIPMYMLIPLLFIEYIEIP